MINISHEREFSPAVYLIIITVFAHGGPGARASEFPLAIEPAGARIELSWPATITNANQEPDYFLTVARSLWATQRVASALGDTGVDQQVATFAAVNSLAIISTLVQSPQAHPRHLRCRQTLARGRH
jgi:hypothetical protein